MTRAQGPIFAKSTWEYLIVPIASDQVDLGTQTVEFRFRGESGQTLIDWTVGEWAPAGTDSTRRDARILIVGPDAADKTGAVELAVGSWSVDVRVTDNPEVPVMRSPLPILVS